MLRCKKVTSAPSGRCLAGHRPLPIRYNTKSPAPSDVAYTRNAKSATPSRIRENYGALEVDLDDEDRERIESMPEGDRKVDGDWTPW